MEANNNHPSISFRSGVFPPVKFTDGTALTSVHLQAVQQHAESLAHHARQQQPFSYGIRGLNLRKDGLANWIVDVEGADMDLPDGAVVVTGVTAVCRPIEFRNLQSDSPRLSVWIGVPFLREDQSNLVEGENTETWDRRYFGTKADLANTLEKPRKGDLQPFRRPVPLLQLNARVIVGETAPTGCSTVKIAELVRVIYDDESRYELATDYIPPCLQMQASPDLVSILMNIHDHVEAQAGLLAGQLKARDDVLRDGFPRDALTLFQLQALNGALPIMRQLRKQPELHPFHCYLYLCRIVGDLTAFSKDWTPPQLQAYDHENLYSCFEGLKKAILELLEGAVEMKTSNRSSFNCDNPSSETWTASSEQLGSGGRYYVGITGEENSETIQQHIRNNLIVFASADRARLLRIRSTGGVPVEYRPEKHPALMNHSGVFFELNPTEQPEFWQEICDAKKVSFSADPSHIEGLTFSLYAVGN
jgi:type VI secretion system protein ImpJ